MKILFLTGSHQRHTYMAERLGETGYLSGLIIEERESAIPAPPQDAEPQTQVLFEKHFRERSAAETQFFGKATLPHVETLRVTRDAINGKEVQAFIKATAPDLLLSYGIHKLSPETLSCAPSARWNIHGGLSPWYRGAITHFWPSYMLEPQMTGMTVHQLTDAIDGGDIIHQVAAPLVEGDGIHDLACRAVKALGEEIAKLVDVLRLGHIQPAIKQSSTGRIWRAADWKPEHLHLVYDLYDNQIVDRHLKHSRSQKPKCVRQF